MKILVVRFSSIGDIVLTSPLVRALKQQLNAEIHFYTKPAFAGILTPNPYISKVYTLPPKTLPFFKALREEQYDYVIDLHHNFRTLLLKKWLGVKSFSYNKLNFQKYLLVNFKINRMPKVHIVDRYMETAKSLGVVNDGKGLDYFIEGKEEVAISTLPASHHNGYVAVVAGATFFTKRIPLGKLIELCEKVDRPVMILGGKGDFAQGNLVELALKEKLPGKIFNACGKYSLGGSASLIRQAEKVFTSDTGLMHIAAAFKRETISFWGNTVPEFGMYPYGTDFKIIETKGLSCRPCSKLGFDKCPKGNFKCMEAIDIEEALGN